MISHISKTYRFYRVRNNVLDFNENNWSIYYKQTVIPQMETENTWILLFVEIKRMSKSWEACKSFNSQNYRFVNVWSLFTATKAIQEFAVFLKWSC